MNPEPEGIVLSCRASGEIESVLRDDLELKRLGTTKLVELVDSLSAEKAGNFLRALTTNGAAFGWELNAIIKGRIVPVLFNGTSMGASFLVVGATTREGVTRLSEAMVAMNNEQTTALRAALKDLSLHQREQAVRDAELLDELSRLNNELVTLQRDLARKNRELEKLNRLKDTFLGMASHDLRKPIAGILMSAQLLKDDGDAAPGSDQPQIIENIQLAAKRLIKQLNEFLDIAQIETGHLRLDRALTDLRELVTARVCFYRNTASVKKIDLTVSVAERIPELWLDRDRVEQVIDNLLENAVKYSPPGGAVEVKLTMLTSENVLLSVRDHGAGLPESQLTRLFLPFKTAGSKPTGGEKSTGLGLAIAKAIVEQHGGRISASNAEDGGALFSVELPARREPTAASS